MASRAAVKVIVGRAARAISQCEDVCGGRGLMVSARAITVNLKELGFTPARQPAVHRGRARRP